MRDEGHCGSSGNPMGCSTWAVITRRLLDASRDCGRDYRVGAADVWRCVCGVVRAWGSGAGRPRLAQRRGLPGSGLVVGRQTALTGPARLVVSVLWCRLQAVSS